MAAKYERIKVIGRGTYGLAWLTKSRSSQRPYVVKEIRLVGMTEKDRNQAVNEVAILAGLKHVNVVRYREAFVEEAMLNIAMEYADGGDLSEMIQARRQAEGYFLQDTIMDWFVQMCFALRYIHAKKILHRDLKPQNIFMTSRGVLKLGDFGIARMLQDTNDHALTAIGTPYYMSPEICRRAPYNQKSDMWAAGCVLYEMTSLVHPFEASDFSSLVLRILRGRYKAIPSHYGPLMEDLIKVLLRVDPERRPSADQLLSVPGIQSHVLAYTNRHDNQPSTSLTDLDKGGRESSHCSSENLRSRDSGIGSRVCHEQRDSNVGGHLASLANDTESAGGSLKDLKSRSQNRRHLSVGRSTEHEVPPKVNSSCGISPSQEGNKVLHARENYAQRVLVKNRQHRVSSTSGVPAKNDSDAEESISKQRSFSVGTEKTDSLKSDEVRMMKRKTSSINKDKSSREFLQRKTAKHTSTCLSPKKSDTSIVDLFNLESRGQTVTRRSLKKSTYILDTPSTTGRGIQGVGDILAHQDYWEMESAGGGLRNTVVERNRPSQDQPSGSDVNRGVLECYPSTSPVGKNQTREGKALDQVESHINDRMFHCRLQEGDSPREVRGKVETLRIFLEENLGVECSLACLDLIRSSSRHKPDSALSVHGVLEKMEAILGDKMTYAPVVLYLHNLEQSCDWMSD